MAVCIEACIESQFSGLCDFSACIFNPVNWLLRAKGLKSVANSDMRDMYVSQFNERQRLLSLTILLVAIIYTLITNTCTIATTKLCIQSMFHTYFHMQDIACSFNRGHQQRAQLQY